MPSTTSINGQIVFKNVVAALPSRVPCRTTESLTANCNRPVRERTARLRGGGAALYAVFGATEVSEARGHRGVVHARGFFDALLVHACEFGAVVDELCN